MLCILREGNRLAVYRFIQDNHKYFGLRWLLRRLDIYPNAYYNYLKNKKAVFQTNKQTVLNQIKGIYHNTKGRLGHRKMKVFLSRKGIFLSKTTVHKYMNNELIYHHYFHNDNELDSAIEEFAYVWYNHKHFLLVLNLTTIKFLL